MEAALELEDDVFFKDLSKQISLLIMDDDDDQDSFSLPPSVNLQAFRQEMHPARQASFFMNYDQQTSRRESKGTGVFIPRSSNPRRKNVKQGRFIGNKFQRPVEQNSTGISYNNNMNPSHDQSINLKRL